MKNKILIIMLVVMLVLVAGFFIINSSKNIVGNISKNNLPARYILSDTIEKLFSDEESLPQGLEKKEDNNEKKIKIRERATKIKLDIEKLKEKDIIKLNLFSDKNFHATISRSIRHSDKSATILGNLNGDVGGTFALSSYNGAVAGSITASDGKHYKISSAENGISKIIEVDSSKYLPEADPHDSENIKTETNNLAITTSDILSYENLADSNSSSAPVIDVLVAYTPAAKNSNGGINGINALINLAVDEANVAYEQSLVNGRIRLVHTVETNYVESGSFNTDLTRFHNKGDGYMDEIPTLRDTYGADLVSLIVDSGDYCGMAYLPRNFNDFYFSLATDHSSVILDSCATGYYSFAHELGHNMGCGHDRENFPSGVTVFNFSYGYRFYGYGPLTVILPNGTYIIIPNASITQYRTIMAYAPGNRIQRFSNPNILYQGNYTGIAENLPNAAYNALTLNKFMPYIANYKPTMVASECTSSSECDDGFYCNGAEQCINYKCQSGAPPIIADTVSCTIDECDETTDTIKHIKDNNFCNDGLFCTGEEICDSVKDCISQSPVSCNDNIECSIDKCDETIDQCVIDNTPCVSAPLCSFSIAKWADINAGTVYALEGANVPIIVQGTNCLGKQLIYKVYEDDGISSDLINSISTPSMNTYWTAKYVDDGINNPPEYYYTVEIVGQTSSNMIKSTNMLIVQKPKICGNGFCESGESAKRCPADCKTSSTTPTNVCGNGKCETGESKRKCPQDCA